MSTGIEQQDVSDFGKGAGVFGSLVKSGFSIYDSITEITTAVEKGNDKEIEALADKRWVLGLVDPGSTRIEGGTPTGVDGDSPIPGLSRFVYRSGNHRDNHKLADQITDGVYTAYLLNGTPLKYAELVKLRSDWYGNNPVLRIRERLISDRVLPAGYTAENIRKIINPPIGFGTPAVPVGWTELIAIRQGFSGEIANAKSRLRAASVASRGADKQDRKIISIKIKNAALIARESKQASNDVRRIREGIPVGI